MKKLTTPRAFTCMIVIVEKTVIREEKELLGMVDIEYIRKKHFLEGWSIRKISRNLGVARQTVRKALESSEIPKYKLSKEKKCPVMDTFQWLEEDKSAPPKQRHTAKRIYERLCEEYDFPGSESSCYC